MSLRRTVILVACLNLLYFGVEVSVAQRVGSVSLFADSVDFLEDASLNILIAVALRWETGSRAKLGMGLAGLLLLPACATLWTAWSKFNHPFPPAALAVSLTGVGALAINLSCAILLTRFRQHKGSLTQAAFLSARNDALANLIIIAVGCITVFIRSVWPDLIAGIGIAVLNADAAFRVWRAAMKEHAAP